MKSKLFGFVFLFVFTPLFLKAQECVFFFPQKVGTELELTSYDKKGKETAITRQKLLKKEVADGKERILIESTLYDDKNNELAKTEVEGSCSDGNYYFNMNNYLNNPSMGAYQNMEVEISSDNLILPGHMKAGDILPGGNITAKITNSGIPIMTFSVDVSDRKVEAIEDITTPAGTFSCYRISYDVETKVMIKVKSKSIEWYAKNVGVVKSESYDSKGKLSGSMLLTSFKK